MGLLHMLKPPDWNRLRPTKHKGTYMLFRRRVKGKEGRATRAITDRRTVVIAMKNENDDIMIGGDRARE